MGQKKTISQKHQKTSNSQKICRRFFQATRFVTTFSLDHPIIIPPLGHPNTARPAGARCAPARAVPSVGHWNFFVGHLQCQISASTATVFVVCFFKGKVNYSSLIYLFLGGMILKYTVYHIGDHGWSWIIQLFHQSPTWKVILNPKSIHCMQVSLSACPSEYSARKCLGIASQMDPLFLSCWITPLSSLYEPSKFGGYMMLHDSGPIPYSRIIVNKCQQVERERERETTWNRGIYHDPIWGCPPRMKRLNGFKWNWPKSWGCAQEAANCWQTKRKSRGKWTARCCTPLPHKGTPLVWFPRGTGSIPQSICIDADVLSNMCTCKYYVWIYIYIYKYMYSVRPHFTNSQTNPNQKWAHGRLVPPISKAS